ncbi:MAG TPA: hypothetical protein VF814_14685 [Casimicrobiaceae bacterium]
MLRVSILAAALAAAAAFPGAANAIMCYTVLDRSDNTIYQDTRPPIDMSAQGAAERNALRARGEYLAISDADRCPLVTAPPGTTGYQPASVESIVSGIREYARSSPGTVPPSSTGRGGGTRPAPRASSARSGSSSARRY